mmetsp:Transcript_53439/g.60781  ORF Transcript_53439/g.60781 Transcript_53439/m.60781 type:complete len:184 (-) Transcript_53439:261-812(-)
MSQYMWEMQNLHEKGVHEGQLVNYIMRGGKKGRDYVLNTLLRECMTKADLDDYTTANNRTAFSVAVKAGDRELVEAIWARYQEVCNAEELRDVLTEKWNYNDEFWTVFMNACVGGDPECIRLIHGYCIGPAMGNVGAVARVEKINSTLTSTLDYWHIHRNAKPLLPLLLGRDNMRWIDNYEAE